MRPCSIIFAISLIAAAGFTFAADIAQPSQGDYVIRDYRFRSGGTLPELRIHYRTLGKPQRDEKGQVRNAVLILHGTTGNGEQFGRVEFASELFAKGQPLDADRYYIVMPDDIGHGRSSKPSDGLKARFPQYGYLDMIDAEFRLVSEGLKLDHLRLVMGTSMGGMHTWLWGEKYPDFMDALMPLACLPAQISGRNRMWRKMISEAIRSDPQWLEGEYTSQPRSLRFAAEMLFFMGGNPLLRYQEAPIRPAGRQTPGRLCFKRDENHGRQRSAVCRGKFGGLRSGSGLGIDPGQACSGQFGRRPDQSSGPGHFGAGNQAGKTRQGDFDSRRSRNPRPRHPHPRRRLEEISGRTAQRNGAPNR